jgi:uncharacterized protein with beta-barrel porin domain
MSRILNSLALGSLLSSYVYAEVASNGPEGNALTTYASQNAYLASSQAVTDHLRQKHFHPQKLVEEPVELADNIAQFFADASETRFNQQPTRQTAEEPDCDRDPFTIWLTPFGEYATEKAQHKTPAFNLGVGGAVGAIEFTTEKSDVVGFGLAYIYTHVHESSHAGKGKVNQGFLTLYGTLNASKWYLDLGAWGGYYDTFNQRKISLPGIKETARSNTHGWQLAPHFEVGYDGYWWCGDELNWFGIEPFLSGDWVANWEHSLREHGADSFNMGQKGRFCSQVRGETGIRFHEIVTLDWGLIVFREKASYAYQKTFHTGSLNTFLIGSPGSFTVNTLTRAQNLGVVEFSMLFIHNDPEKPYVDLRYQGEFGSNYQSHQLMLELGTNF